MPTKWPQERRDQLYELLSQESKPSVAEVAQILGVTIAAVKHQMSNLKIAGRDTRFKAKSTTTVVEHVSEDKSLGFGMRVLGDYASRSNALPVLFMGSYDEFTQVQVMLHVEGNAVHVGTGE